MSEVMLRLPMTPDRRMAHNKSRGKSMWTMGDWIKADREKAKHMAAPRGVYISVTEPVTVEVTIYWGKSLKAGKVRARIEQDRRFDWDSATALCKPMIDGALVDTGLIADDRQIQWGTVKQDVDPSGEGFTEIVIRKVAA